MSDLIRSRTSSSISGLRASICRAGPTKCLAHRQPAVDGGVAVGPRSLTPLQAGLAAAQELAETFDELSEEEKDQLKQSLEDLTRDTPRTAVAESRFKRLVKKAGSDAYEGMRSSLVEVVSETVKKSLFGG